MKVGSGRGLERSVLSLSGRTDPPADASTTKPAASDPDEQDGGQRERTPTLRLHLGRLTDQKPVSRNGRRDVENACDVAASAPAVCSSTSPARPSRASDGRPR